MLSRIVEWYNDIKLKTAPCEFEIIRKDVELIDNKLQIALDTATWSDYEEVYIVDLHNDLKNLHTRMMQAQTNVDKIIKHIKAWGSQPMFQRHEGVNTKLMMPEDFPGMIVRRQTSCLESKKLIDEIIDENFRLFFNLRLRPQGKKIEVSAKRSVMKSIETLKSIDEGDRPSEMNVADTDKAAQASESYINIKAIRTPSTASSTFSEASFEIIKTPEQIELFRAYEEHIDSVIWQEIRDALHESIKYIKFEMENRLEHDAPIFEVKLELEEQQIIFNPILTVEITYSQGLLATITSLIKNILNMSAMIPRVAKPEIAEIDSGLETFWMFFENAAARGDREVATIENMHMDITMLARETITEARKFAYTFEKYNFLWRLDKKAYLKNFLRYGRVLTTEEIEQIDEGTLTVREKEPELEAFKKEIDYYNMLHEEIDRNDTIHIFNSWLKVNMKGLKYSILNEVCKWSFLFKQYLKDKVVDDLKELEDFIVISTESLGQEVTKDDSVTLLKILKTIGSIVEREQSTDHMFEPLKHVVDFLNSYDMSFDDYISNQFAELPERWITLKKLAVIVKQRIAPVQAYQVDLIKKRISMFDLRTKLYFENFMRAPFFQVPCLNVYELCDLVHEELTDMEKQNVGLRESALHFQLSPPEEGKIILSRKLVKMVKHIWDFFHVVSSCIDDWKMTPWKKINVEDMETECKRFSKDMRNFDRDMKTLKPYIETEAMIKNLLTSLRAITELQNPAIRERHWTELMVATKVSLRSHGYLHRYFHNHKSIRSFTKASRFQNHFNWFLVTFCPLNSKIYKLKGYPVCGHFFDRQFS